MILGVIGCLSSLKVRNHGEISSGASGNRQFAGLWAHDGWSRVHDTDGRSVIRPDTVAGRTFYCSIAAEKEVERHTRLEEYERTGRSATDRESRTEAEVTHA